MLFTRTITTYEATAYNTVLDTETMQASVEKIATVHFKGTSPSKTDARKAFQEQGYTIPRGTEIVMKVVKDEKYACTLEEFLEVAQKIDEE